MRSFSLFIVLLFMTFSALTAETDMVSIGKKFTIHSKVIGEDRSVWVYVPENLKKDEPLYTIYLLDGREHFHTVTGIVKSLLDYRQIPKTMVVGIETTNRSRDFLPKVDGKPKTKFQEFVSSKWPEGGKTDNFLKFMQQELIPYIDKNYSTYPHRTLIGHSNGGTLSLYALFNKPELFNNYLTISPNGWWSHDETIANVKKLTDPNRPYEKIFLSVAGEGGRFYTGVLDLLAAIEKNKPPRLESQFKHYPNQTHMTGILPAVSEGLEYLFRDLNFEITTELAGYADVSVIKNYYNELSKKYGFKVQIPIDIYVEFAEQQQNNKRKTEAVETLIQFVAAYPDLPYAHMSLGRGYMLLEQFENAKKNFEQALSHAKKQKKEAQILDALQDMVNTAHSKL